MIRIGMIIGDRFEVQEKIGTGGMSDVYRALDHKLNRPVAVKILKQEFSENQNFVDKFRTEAQAAAGLMHPNIVNIYDVGNDKGIHYIVMELVDGITLKKYIEKKQRLTVREAVSIAIQVAMGLEAAHKNGIVHRDIKPQNIMISKDGKVKVTDFGIAKAASSNTITSNVMGSVHYTSPEQARGGFSDAKSDIYSLGVTIFEMVTGRVPFNGDTTVAIAIKHIQETFPNPKEYASNLPVSVEKIILKCCQKSPDRRYQSAGDLIKDLKRSLITPDEDFVVLIDPDAEGATRIATDGEQEMIRHSTTGSFSKTEQMRLNEVEEKKKVEPARPRKNNEYIARENKRYESTPKKYALEEQTSPRRSEDNMDRLIIVMAVVALILVGIIVIFMVGSQIGLFGGNSGEDSSISSSTASTGASQSGMTVPDLLGKSFAEAKSILSGENSQYGYVVQKEDDVTSAEKRNVVTGQSVKAGDRLERGETIILKVSTGEHKSKEAVEELSSSNVASTKASLSQSQKVTMPGVVGMDEATARLALIEKGFSDNKITIVEVNDNDAAKTGMIIKQSPAAETVVSTSSSITLEVSIGPATAVTTYSYSGTIEAPTENQYYSNGVVVTICITSADGTQLLNTQVTNFPYQVSQITGITSGTGTLEMSFDATLPISTDPATGQQTGGAVQRQTVTRPLTFAPQG
ncbi:Stk1 family PASTA domain-containing Ser/Thr kinase [Butyrivibrio sp. NC3005]|uniref:Stk1 family PASTA domain-containing Ser/Thr kinase n=1 Tax=Butyrivibrio sp. NC3005 TaxID=1280685 RepID=UPI0003F6DF61|nr:Stk1 family PASTA domain-containing Ser/Thr kinase [Butyrivibrio sp. NC3005]